MKKIITLLVTVITLSITAQDSVLLRLKYKVGSSYYTKIQMIQSAPMMKNNMTLDMKTKVISLKKGVVETEVFFDKMVVDGEMQGKKIKFSSDIKEEEEDMSPITKKLHTLMKGLKSTVVLMYYDERGEIKDVKMKSGPKYNLQLFKESSPIEYPKKAVKVGSTWKQSVSKNGMKISSIYTVKAISAKEVVLNVVGSISGQGKGESDGVIIIDTVTGHTLKSNINMNISASGMEVKMKVNITSSKI